MRGGEVAIAVVLLCSVLFAFAESSSLTPAQSHKSASPQSITASTAVNCSSLPKCKQGHQECRFSNATHNAEETRNSIMGAFKEFVKTKFYDKKNLFLFGGSLIGAKRNGNFIPWDDDGDIATTRSHFNKMKKAAGGKDVKFGPNNQYLLSLECRFADIPGRVIDTKTGLYIDIFAFYDSTNYKTADFPYSEYWPKYKKMEKDDLFCPHPFPERSLKCKHFKRSSIYPLTPCTFEGIEFSCPANSESMLSNCYGPDWKVPDKKIVDAF